MPDICSECDGPILTEHEGKLLETASRWVLYDEQIRNADGPRRGELILARDAAGHDMRLLAGAECGCDDGTCPGLLSAP